MGSRRRTLIRTGLAWALITVAVCAVVIVWASRPRAHEPYAWIAKHYGVANDKWKNGDFGGCCGPKDCFPVSIKPEIRNGKHGYLTGDGDWVPHADTHPSRDPAGRHWRCYQMLVIGGTLLKGKPRERCIFVSPGTF